MSSSEEILTRLPVKKKHSLKLKKKLSPSPTPSPKLSLKQSANEPLIKLPKKKPVNISVSPIISKGTENREVELPDEPKFPELLELPDLSKLPDVPKLPELPELPDLSKLPDVPKLPELLDLPDLPDLPLSLNFTKKKQIFNLAKSLKNKSPTSNNDNGFAELTKRFKKLSGIPNLSEKLIKSVMPDKDTSHIQNFKNQFESFFKDHDIIEEYEVSDDMIIPYLNINGFQESPRIDIWKQIFKENRYLLYIDQFISFGYITIIDHNFTIQKFIDEFYFKLDIAKKIDKQTKINDYDKILGLYSAEIYKELEKLLYNISNGFNTDKIDGISVILAHGNIDILTSYCIVPDNIIIAFTAPFNKLLSANINTQLNAIFDLTSAEIEKDKRGEREYPGYNQSFLTNPTCSFKYNECFKNIIYFYPGQVIPNYSLSFNTNNEADKLCGFYPQKDINIKEALFNNLNINKPNILSTSINDIFNNPQKLEMIKNKIIYINCCRKCENILPHITLEFLYRYEHIINFINISRCLSFEMRQESCKINTYDLFYKTNASVLARNMQPITSNNTKYNFFYDSALSYSFKTNYIKKQMYLGKSAAKWESALNILDELTNTSKVEYSIQILTYLFVMIKRNQVLYTQRIIDLLNRILTYDENFRLLIISSFPKWLIKNLSILIDIIPEDQYKEIQKYLTLLSK